MATLPARLGRWELLGLGLGASRPGTRKGVSLSARGLPFPPPSTLHLGVSLLPPTFKPSSSPADPQGRLSWVLAATPAGGALGRVSRRGRDGACALEGSWRRGGCPHFLVGAGRWAAGVASGSRQPWSPPPPLLPGARGRGSPGSRPSRCVPPGTAPQVRRRRSRRVCRRAASAGAAEREPGPAAPRVSAGRRRPLLPLPGPGGQRRPRRSRLPRRALCASSERNFLSRDSEAGVSLLLKGSRGGAGAPGRKPRAPEPDRPGLGVSRSLGAWRRPGLGTGETAAGPGGLA